MEIGSLEWAKATYSSLNRRDRFNFVGKLIRTQLEDFGLRVAAQTGISNRKLARVNLDKIIIPDSKYVLETNSYANEVYNPVLFKHCIRTYFLGSMVAQYYDYKIDSEMLYISSMLHDLGISKPHLNSACSCCFAVVGAELAYNFVTDLGMENHQANQIYNAISIHLNPHISGNQDKEAIVLGTGAAMDVIGTKLSCIPKLERKKLIQLYDRSGLLEEIITSANETKHFKNSRADFLRKMGFAKLVAKNPLDSH